MLSKIMPHLRKLLKSYASFSRTERAGLLVFSVLFAVFVLIRATMSMWVDSFPSNEQNTRLASAWKVLNEHQNTNNNSDNRVAASGMVNLNEADSATLVSLKGIGPVTAHNILTRIEKKGAFTDINQLREVGGFSDSAFAALKRQLIINPPSSIR
jgi:hypothetical protein